MKIRCAVAVPALTVLTLLTACGSSIPLGRQPAVYVVSSQSQTISAFRSNENAGTLVPVSGSPFRSRSDPSAIAGWWKLGMDSRNEFLFLLADKLEVFAIDQQSGALSAVQGSPFSFMGSSRSFAVDPQGRFVYVSTSNAGIWGWSIDRNQRTLVPIAGAPFGMAVRADMINIDPQGRFLYGCGDLYGLQVYALDSGTGALTAAGAPVNLVVPIGITQVRLSPATMTIHPAGTLAYVNANDTGLMMDLVSIHLDPQSGAISGAADLPFDGASRLYISPDGKWLFGSPNDQYTIDLTSGTLQLISHPFDLGIAAATFREDGKFAYIANRSGEPSVSVYPVNPTGGALVPVSGPPHEIDGPPVDIVATK